MMGRPRIVQTKTAAHSPPFKPAIFYNKSAFSIRRRLPLPFELQLDVGALVGSLVMGAQVGCTVGLAEGLGVDGLIEGLAEGDCENGCRVGLRDGCAVGRSVDGLAEGLLDGLAEGWGVVGDMDGLREGDGVSRGTSKHSACAFEEQAWNACVERRLTSEYPTAPIAPELSLDQPSHVSVTRWPMA